MTPLSRIMHQVAKTPLDLLLYSYIQGYKNNQQCIFIDPVD